MHSFDVWFCLHSSLFITSDPSSSSVKQITISIRLMTLLTFKRVWNFSESVCDTFKRVFVALSTLFLPSPLECYYFFNYSYTTLRKTHTANSCSSGGHCPCTPAGPCRPPPPPSPSPPPPCSRLLLLWTMERRAECRERPALLRSCDFSLGSSSHAQNISYTRYIP